MNLKTKSLIQQRFRLKDGTVNQKIDVYFDGYIVNNNIIFNNNYNVGLTSDWSITFEVNLKKTAAEVRTEPTN